MAAAAAPLVAESLVVRVPQIWKPGAARSACARPGTDERAAITSTGARSTSSSSSHRPCATACVTTPGCHWNSPAASEQMYEPSSTFESSCSSRCTLTMLAPRPSLRASSHSSAVLPQPEGPLSSTWSGSGSGFGSGLGSGSGSGLDLSLGLGLGLGLANAARGSTQQHLVRVGGYLTLTLTLTQPEGPLSSTGCAAPSASVIARSAASACGVGTWVGVGVGVRLRLRR
eukprot:scaffold7563_cov52-Phaeocystis_antarctica.AAC.1